MATRDLSLRTVCNELGTVAHKALVIGVQLGLPRYKLEQLKGGDSFLIGIIDYWLNDNVEGATLTWEWLVKALRSIQVDEGGLAYKISQKYCKTGGGYSTGYAPQHSPMAPQHSPMGVQQAGHIPVQSPNLPSQTTPHTTPQVTTPTRATQQASLPSQTATNSPQVVGVPEEFSKRFTPDQLYLWLLLDANQMSEVDCVIIKGKKIGGVAFKGMLEDNDFDGFGISKFGVYSLKDIKEKIVQAPSASLDSITTRATDRNIDVSSRIQDVLDKGITQSKLNLMKWRNNGDEKSLHLKERMSVKWREMGQNVGIGDANLTGFEDKHRGDNIKCMDSVITDWIAMTSEKYPTTWAGLIKLLKSVDLNNLANMIVEAAADEESTLYNL